MKGRKMKRLTHKSRSEAGYKENRGVPVWECIDKLGQLEDLQERGRLLELPCDVNREVWYVDTYEGIYAPRIVRGVVDGYLWFRTCGFALNVVWDKPIMGHFAYNRKEMPFSEVGKTVFLTRKKAEEALKRMEDGNE